jgi:hypothetical protein
MKFPTRIGEVMKKQKVVKGFVVRREWTEKDPNRADRIIKHRADVGRLYHSREAAMTLLGLVQKDHPDRTLWVHERTGVDGLNHPLPA